MEVTHVSGQEPLLRAAEVALALNVSRRTVRRLTNEGKLPCVQLTPRIRRWRREAVEALIRESGSVTAG